MDTETERNKQAREDIGRDWNYAATAKKYQSLLATMIEGVWKNSSLDRAFEGSMALLTP